MSPDTQSAGLYSAAHLILFELGRFAGRKARCTCPAIFSWAVVSSAILSDAGADVIFGVFFVASTILPILTLPTGMFRRSSKGT